MICKYCHKDIEDSKHTYPELKELIRSKGITSSCYIDELDKINKIFFAKDMSPFIHICIDCECAIAEDSDKFILKQRLLR